MTIFDNEEYHVTVIIIVNNSERNERYEQLQFLIRIGKFKIKNGITTILAMHIIYKVEKSMDNIFAEKCGYNGRQWYEKSQRDFLILQQKDVD